jgi:ParB family chromosome partitioning protein
MDAPTYREIALDLIDEPPDPIRKGMDPLLLAELAASIDQLGQLQPCVVVPVGERFEVVAGHRRYLALDMLHAATARCLVFTDLVDARRAAQLQENTERENLNVVDEAIWIQQVCDGFGGDIDRTCAEFKKSRDYIDSRLLLARGDQDVLAAVAQGAIGLAVAKLLNGVEDDGKRLYFLHAAISGGSTARVVAQWISDWRGQVAEGIPTAPAPTISDAPEPEAVERWIPRCFFCEDTEEPHTMLTLQIHKHCLKSLRKQLAGALEKGSK